MPRNRRPNLEDEIAKSSAAEGSQSIRHEIDEASVANAKKREKLRSIIDKLINACQDPIGCHFSEHSYRLYSEGHAYENVSEINQDLYEKKVGYVTGERLLTKNNEQLIYISDTLRKKIHTILARINNLETDNLTEISAGLIKLYELLCCPFTGQLMRCPVTFAGDGWAYEAYALQQLAEQQLVSPPLAEAFSFFKPAFRPEDPELHLKVEAFELFEPEDDGSRRRRELVFRQRVANHAIPNYSLKGIIEAFASVLKIEEERFPREVQAMMPEDLDLSAQRVDWHYRNRKYWSMMDYGIHILSRIFYPAWKYRYYLIGFAIQVIVAYSSARYFRAHYTSDASMSTLNKTIENSFFDTFNDLLCNQFPIIRDTLKKSYGRSPSIDDVPIFFPDLQKTTHAQIPYVCGDLMPNQYKTALESVLSINGLIGLSLIPAGLKTLFFSLLYKLNADMPKGISYFTYTLSPIILFCLDSIFYCSSRIREPVFSLHADEAALSKQCALSAASACLYNPQNYMPDYVSFWNKDCLPAPNGILLPEVKSTFHIGNDPIGFLFSVALFTIAATVLPNLGAHAANALIDFVLNAMLEEEKKPRLCCQPKPPKLPKNVKLFFDNVHPKGSQKHERHHANLHFGIGKRTGR